MESLEGILCGDAECYITKGYAEEIRSEWYPKALLDMTNPLSGMSNNNQGIYFFLNSKCHEPQHATVLLSVVQAKMMVMTLIRLSLHLC